jgi:hypothetical protein
MRTWAMAEPFILLASFCAYDAFVLPSSLDDMYLRRGVVLTLSRQDSRRDTNSDSESERIRVLEFSFEPSKVALQAATLRYRDDTGTVVDLFAVVHVADAQYYASLTQQLSHNDIVLYEMITDKRNVLQLDMHRKVAFVAPSCCSSRVHVAGASQTAVPVSTSAESCS